MSVLSRICRAPFLYFFIPLAGRTVDQVPYKTHFTWFEVYLHFPNDPLTAASEKPILRRYFLGPHSTIQKKEAFLGMFLNLPSCRHASGKAWMFVFVFFWCVSVAFCC